MNILYRDDDLVVVDKPSGLPVHAAAGRPDGLVEQLSEAFGPLHLGHRLDAGASGLVALARSPEAAAALGRAFADGRVDKRYLALVAGRVAKQGAVNRPLEQRRAGRETRLVRDVRTRYRLREAFPGWSLVEVTIEGGKTHQIRRHMAMTGHALAGDRRYGQRWRNERIAHDAGLERLFLHAATLSVPHPRTGAVVRLGSPLPVELQGVLDRLAGRTHADGDGDGDGQRLDQARREP